MSLRTFLKKILKYYASRLRDPGGKKPEGEPESSSFLGIYMLAIPPFVSWLVTMMDSWLLRILFLFAGISIVTDLLFRDEKGLTRRRMEQWIGFLYSLEDRSAHTVAEERDAEAGQGKQRSVQQERRKGAGSRAGAGIYVDPALSEWENAVIQICDKLRIRKVSVVSEACVKESFSGRLAMTEANPEGVPTVVLSTGMVKELRKEKMPQLVYDMVCFVLGHELTHVRYRDYSRRRRAFKMLAVMIVSLAMLFGGVYVASCIMKYVIWPGECFLVVLFLAVVIFQKRLSKETYWIYVSEYRADRKSAEFSGASTEAMEAALRMEPVEKENERTGIWRKRNKTHPGADSRLKELQRNKKWGISEYVRYAIRLEW